MQSISHWARRLVGMFLLALAFTHISPAEQEAKTGGRTVRMEQYDDEDIREKLLRILHAHSASRRLAPESEA